MLFLHLPIFSDSGIYFISGIEEVFWRYRRFGDTGVLEITSFWRYRCFGDTGVLEIPVFPSKINFTFLVTNHRHLET